MYKILCVLHGLVGEVVCSEPLLHEIRLIYPFAEIYVQTKLTELLTSNPDGFKVVAEPYDIRGMCFDRTYIIITDGNSHSTRGFAELFGIKLTRDLPRIYCRANIDKFALPEKYVVVSNDANTRDRQLSVADYKSVISFLEKQGYNVVALGRRSFNLKTEYDLEKRTTLREAVEVVRQSLFCVVADSGLSHIAAACKKKYITWVNVRPEWRYHEGYSCLVPATFEALTCELGHWKNLTTDYTDSAD